jgi:hypothetical protein
MTPELEAQRAREVLDAWVSMRRRGRLALHTLAAIAGVL